MPFSFVLVIPAYHEPDLLSTLKSLQQAEKPTATWHIIVVLNGPISEANALLSVYATAKEQINSWYSDWHNPHFSLQIETHFFSDKKAGVGSARKYGMDIAVHLLNDTGWIVNLDADCLVSVDYFTHIQQIVSQYKKAQLINLGYSHTPFIIQKNIKDPILIRGILSYEAHLKHFEKLLHEAGHPFACQTIGSAFAVRRDTYIKVGGMNTRKAGEDFYFIQKVVKYFPFHNDYKPIVFPSCRISHRVPFGTGKAQKVYQQTGVQYTYNRKAAHLLTIFFQWVDHLLKKTDAIKELDLSAIPQEVSQFLHKVGFSENLQSIYTHTASISERKRRFFQWFDLFMCIKFFHFLEENGYPKEQIGYINGEIDTVVKDLLDLTPAKDDRKV